MEGRRGSGRRCGNRGGCIRGNWRIRGRGDRRVGWDEWDRNGSGAPGWIAGYGGGDPGGREICTGGGRGRFVRPLIAEGHGNQDYDGHEGHDRHHPSYH